MSKTKNTNNKRVSNNKIMTRYDLTFSDIDVQLDSKAIGIIMVVNKTK